MPGFCQGMEGVPYDGFEFSSGRGFNHSAVRANATGVRCWRPITLDDEPNYPKFRVVGR
jgi:hypothetical protein